MQGNGQLAGLDFGSLPKSVALAILASLATLRKVDGQFQHFPKECWTAIKKQPFVLEDITMPRNIFYIIGVIVVIIIILSLLGLV